jgi:hypothetical protein
VTLFNATFFFFTFVFLRTTTLYAAYALQIADRINSLLAASHQ